MDFEVISPENRMGEGKAGGTEGPPTGKHFIYFYRFQGCSLLPRWDPYQLYPWTSLYQPFGFTVCISRRCSFVPKPVTHLDKMQYYF